MCQRFNHLTERYKRLFIYDRQHMMGLSKFYFSFVFMLTCIHGFIIKTWLSVHFHLVLLVWTLNLGIDMAVLIRFLGYRNCQFSQADSYQLLLK